MTIEIKDFAPVVEETQPLSIGDFVAARPTRTAISARSASQIAATQSLLTDTDPEAYRSTRARLLDPAARGQFVVEQEQLREAIYEDSLQSLLTMVGDESVPYDQRFAAAVGAGAGPQAMAAQHTPNLNLLAEEAAVADSGPEETDRAAESRLDALGVITEVNDRKRRIATAINGLRLGEDMTASEMAVDIAERFIPLVEWNHTDLLLRDANRRYGVDSQEAQLLGTQKAELYEIIASLPTSEREAFAYSMIDLVRQHENVLFTDGNDLLTLETLERMLLDNDYSDTERWIEAQPPSWILLV